VLGVGLYTSLGARYKSNTSLARQLALGLVGGDRLALSQAITLIESQRPSDVAVATSLFQEVATASVSQERSHDGEKTSLKRTLRVGISGPPGVGKSSMIEALGLHILGVDRSCRIAVLSIDPSSVVSGGSVLADKTRMVELTKDKRVFVRPSPSRGNLGGVAQDTSDAILLCEAAGYNLILVETVGIGQSEVTIGQTVDMTCLLLAAGGGDQLQGLKKGILEVADLLIVTKADGPSLAAANLTKADFQYATRLRSTNRTLWTPPVLLSSINTNTNQYLTEIWNSICDFDRLIMKYGQKEEKRLEQRQAWLKMQLRDTLYQYVTSLPNFERQFSEMIGHLEQFPALSPRAAAALLVHRLIPKST